MIIITIRIHIKCCVNKTYLFFMFLLICSIMAGYISLRSQPRPESLCGQACRAKSILFWFIILFLIQLHLAWNNIGGMTVNDLPLVTILLLNWLFCIYNIHTANTKVSESILHCVNCYCWANGGRKINSTLKTKANFLGIGVFIRLLDWDLLDFKKRSETLCVVFPKKWGEQPVLISVQPGVWFTIVQINIIFKVIVH